MLPQSKCWPAHTAVQLLCDAPGNTIERPVVPQVTQAVTPTVAADWRASLYDLTAKPTSTFQPQVPTFWPVAAHILSAAEARSPMRKFGTTCRTMGDRRRSKRRVAAPIMAASRKCPGFA